MAKVLSAKLPDYPNYIIRSNGEIMGHIRLKNPRALKPWVDKDGYRRVHLCNKWGRKGFSVAFLVLSTFKPKPSNDYTVNHINGIKTDDQLENLEWTTVGENQRHSVRAGLKGKLCEADIVEILKRLEGGDKQTYIARDYGVFHSVIGRIQRKENKVWKHLY